MYKVIVCPDEYCRGVSIIKDEVETVKCRSCGSQYKFRKYKVSYKTGDKDSAIEARTRLLMKINDDDREYEELEEDGLLDEPDDPTEERRDNRTPQEIVIDAVKNQSNPSKDDVVQMAVSEGLDEEKALKVVDRLLRKGWAINTDEGIQML